MGELNSNLADGFISANKPIPYRVIVPALKIIQPGLGVVLVAAVPIRILQSDSGS